MRILQLGKFYPIRGGVEKVMWSLTEALSEAGVDCDMLCACLPEDGPDYQDRKYLEQEPDPAFPEGTMVFRFSELNRVICVPALRKAAATMISPAMCRVLRRIAPHYDVIHVHHPDPMAALALRVSGFGGRVVLHWHSDILKQKTLLKLYRPLQRWLIGRADRIVGTTPVYVAGSPYLADVQDKVTYLPIGIKPMEADPALVSRLRERFHGKRIIFSMGRLVEYKGYEYLVRAASLLPPDYQIVIGGQGPLYGDLEQLARDLGISDRVTLLGWVPDEDSAAWFAACDVFVLSSIMKTEAFAIVQAEAMSHGKPVVSTRIPGSGVSWVNADGESGLTVPVCDAAALSEGIRKILSDPDTYAAFCSGALNRYSTLFTRDSMVKGAMNIYASL